MSYRLQISASSLDIARGYDGLLRGKPEPILILAAYVTDGDAIRTLGKSLHRFFPKKPFPSSVEPEERMGLTAHVSVQDNAVRFVILALALEEDGGEDVQGLYGATERPEELSVWPVSSDNPTPLSLSELPPSKEWRYPTRTNLLIAGEDAMTRRSSDKWVGCVAWVLPARHRNGVSLYRLPFVSEDGRNDWTAIVQLGQ